MNTEITDNIKSIESFMDSELQKRKDGRMDYISRNSIAYKLAVEATSNPKVKIYTSRIYKMSQQAHQSDVIHILKSSNVPHIYGNDSMRGGISGNFVKVI